MDLIHLVVPEGSTEEELRLHVARKIKEAVDSTPLSFYAEFSDKVCSNYEKSEAGEKLDDGVLIEF